MRKYIAVQNKTIIATADNIIDLKKDICAYFQITGTYFLAELITKYKLTILSEEINHA
jgi:hypothetical protein